MKISFHKSSGSVFSQTDADPDLDPDHRLILRSSTPLLKSRNAGVVLGVCSLHFYCGSKNQAVELQVGKALIRILRNHREIQYVVLHAIANMAHIQPSLFVSFLPDFFIKSSDPLFNKMLKLDILTSIATKQNVQLIMRELQLYAKHTSMKFVAAAVQAVARIADIDETLTNTCMDGLLYLMACTKAPEVVNEVVNSLRMILQQNSSLQSSTHVLRSLVKQLVMEDGITEVSARTSIVWLVGEFYSKLEDVAPDVLRILASDFPEEVLIFILIFILISILIFILIGTNFHTNRHTNDLRAPRLNCRL